MLQYVQKVPWVGLVLVLSHLLTQRNQTAFGRRILKLAGTSAVSQSLPLCSLSPLEASATFAGLLALYRGAECKG